MLSVLGIIGGKTIGKYVVIAGAVAAVAFGLWVAVQSYNKAIAKAAQGEIKLTQANSETETANANTDKLARMYTARSEDLARERRISQQRRIRANEASLALASNLNMLDFAAVNYGLCKQLRRIQGSPVAGCEPLSEAGQASAKRYTPIATIDRTSIIGLEAALSQCADYIESVENSIPDKPKENDSEP